MPEIARFYGIIIRMFTEVVVQHNRPHFHAYCQDAVGIFAIDDVEMIGGEMGRKERRLIEAWAELHKDELAKDWTLGPVTEQLRQLWPPIHPG